MNVLRSAVESWYVYRMCVLFSSVKGTQYNTYCVKTYKTDGEKVALINLISADQLQTLNVKLSFIQKLIS